MRIIIVNNQLLPELRRRRTIRYLVGLGCRNILIKNSARSIRAADLDEHGRTTFLIEQYKLGIRRYLAAVKRITPMIDQGRDVHLVIARPTPCLPDHPALPLGASVIPWAYTGAELAKSLEIPLPGGWVDC